MEKPALTFAVIADSHINPSDVGNMSPFESHRQTNARLKKSIQILNELRPDFVVHVGDMVHPVPAADEYEQSAMQFRDAIAYLEAPVYLTPGNHDIGDKSAPHVPAGSIREQYLEKYRREFGDDYYSFDKGPCHFVVINTSLINSGLPAEQEQRVWLERDLSGANGRRLVMFCHYPPFIQCTEEVDHYDNIDEPGRTWILQIIERYKIETVFTGHVHNFFYNRAAGAKIYSMPSVAFVRGDYSEMFRVGQTDGSEGGRNDVAKLAIAVVDVYDRRIVTQMIRIFGRVDDNGSLVPQRHWPHLHPAATGGDLGVDLRGSWTEIVEIPYSSMLDEFRRKKARNDYPVMCLWEMGIRKLRIPIGDLMQSGSRDRVAAMVDNGSRFTVFTFGLPDAKAMAVLRENRGLFASIEIVLPWPLRETDVAQLVDIKKDLGVKLALSRFWNAASELKGGGQIKLLADHGFSVEDYRIVRDLAERLPRGCVDRLVFRVSASADPDETVTRVREICSETRFLPQVHLRLATDSPAVAANDEWTNMTRVLRGAILATTHKEMDVFIDTLSDVDRGYFPRIGLVDRRFNPRLAGRVLRNFHGVLANAAARVESVSWSDVDGGACALLTGAGLAAAVVIPHRGSAVQLMKLAPLADRSQTGTTVSILDLADGSTGRIDVSAQGGEAHPARVQTLRSPALIDMTGQLLLCS